MKSETTPPESGDEITDQTLIHHAVDLTLSLLSCIRGEDINPRKHWTWAQKALKTGAARGSDFESMLSEMYDQLPIRDAIHRKKEANSIYSIKTWLDSSGTYRRFRYICKTRAPAIIMLARVRKEQSRAGDGDRSSDWVDGPESFDFSTDTEDA